MVKVCACCGRAFEAQRSTARFCSHKCRQRYWSIGRAVTNGAPPEVFVPESFDDVAEALDEARRVSNTLARLAVTGPRQLRPGCQRIADGIAALIKKEDW